MRSGTNCEKCMGTQLLPENQDAIEIYMLVRRFNRPVTFESLHRAKYDFDIAGVDIWRQLSLIHDQFEEVRAYRMQQENEKSKVR